MREFLSTPERIIQRHLPMHLRDVGADAAPGYHLLAWRQGEPVLVLRRGLASLEDAISIRPETRFHCASIAKQLTAYCVRLAEKRGLLRGQDSIRDLLAGLPTWTEEITIEHLLSHTSGIRDQWVLLDLAGWTHGDPVHTNNVLEITRRQAGPAFPPGTQFSYCNTGYTLLAAALEDIFQCTFREIIARHVCEPLGLTHTTVRSDPDEIVPGHCTGYTTVEMNYGTPAGFRFQRDHPPYGVIGSTCVVSTPNDLCRWAHALSIEDQRLPAAATLNERRVRQARAPLPYGDGQFMTDDGVRYHAGMDHGFNGILIRDPASEVVLCGLSNASFSGIEAAAWETFRELREAPRDAPRTRSAGEVGTAGHGPAEAPERIAGIYVSEQGDQIRRVEATATGLFVHWGPGLHLEPDKDGSFVHPSTGARYRFYPGTERGGTTLTISNRQAVEHFRFLDTDEAAIRRAEQDLPGIYLSPELDAVITVEREPKTAELVLTLPKNRRHRVTAADAEMFLLEGYWGHILRNARGVVTGINVCHPRAGDNHFRRIE